MLLGAMQRPGSKRARLAALAVLLAAAVAAVASLPGAAALYGPRGPYVSDTFEPVFDPKDGCMDITRIAGVNKTDLDADYRGTLNRDYSSVCTDAGHQYVSKSSGVFHFPSKSVFKSYFIKVQCRRCGLKDHKLIRIPFVNPYDDDYAKKGCPPGWTVLANQSLATDYEGEEMVWSWLCAAYRPPCLKCEYKWRGTAPWCNGYCQSNETLLLRSSGDWSDGDSCHFGTKDLCEHCPGGYPFDLGSPKCNNTCSKECETLGETLYLRDNVDAQCPDRMWCGKCPPKPANQLCTNSSGGSLLGGGGGAKAKCGGQATGMRWTDKPSTAAKGVKSGTACCTACLSNARCRRYQFSAAKGVGCQLFYSKAPVGKSLTKNARGYVRGQKIAQ